MRVITVDGTATDYAYDYEGNRVKKTVTPNGGSATSTIYIGDVYEKTGSTVTTHIFAGGQRVGMRQNGVVTYSHGDHLGSTSLMTNGAGAIVQTTRYTPYGNVYESSGSVTDVGFTGHRMDGDGLIYMKARYYDPGLGRFLTPDSIVQDAFDPQTLNRYSYVRDNPINLLDPSGHSWLSKTIRGTGRYIHDHNITFGLLLQTFGGGPLGLIGGSSVLYQSRGGRNLLAGEMIAGTAIATFGCGGCGTGWSTLAGEAVGAYSAKRKNNELLAGVAIGGAEGWFMGTWFQGISASAMNPVEKVLLKAHIGGVMSKLNGGSYTKGFTFSAAFATAEWGFESALGYPPDSSPGKGIPNSNGLSGQYSGDVPPGTENTIGFNQPLKGDFMSDFGTQGGFVSRSLNPIPTVNAFSKVHDLWQNTTSWVPNFTSMPFAMAFSDAALLGGQLAPIGSYYAAKN